MNTADPRWQPDAQLLAAYFDGELEGRDELADMRARVEAWLETHPEAAAQWQEHRRLQKLWLDTTVPEPNDAVWCDTLTKIRAARIGSRAPDRLRRWLAAGVMAACLLVLAGVGWKALQSLPSGTPVAGPVAPLQLLPAFPRPEPVEVFEVAVASEITILRVEGADTGTLVVGVPPVEGELELAEVGEVRVVHVRPDARDRMVPNVRHEGRPMIWARLETD